MLNIPATHWGTAVLNTQEDHVLFDYQVEFL